MALLSYAYFSKHKDDTGKEEKKTKIDFVMQLLVGQPISEQSK